MKAPDGTMLEIIPGEGKRPDNEFRTLGIRHLAISVDDFDAALGDLTSKNIEIENLVNAGGNRLAFFRDVEGNICHIIHREQAI